MTDTTQQNKELTKQYFAALGAWQADTVLDLVSDDLEYWVAGSLPKLSGTFTKSDIKGMLPGFKAMFPEGMQLKTVAFTAEGNRVAVEVECHGRTFGGREYNNFLHFLFEFRNGKIVRVREYMDTAHAKEIFAA